MSESILLDAITNLKEKYHLTSYQQKKIDDYFKIIKAGDYIYAGSLKSKLAIDIKTAYKLLEYLKEKGFLVNIYEVYCKECSRSKGIFLNSISDFESYTCCEFCNKELNRLDNLIVLYKAVYICQPHMRKDKSI